MSQEKSVVSSHYLNFSLLSPLLILFGQRSMLGFVLCSPGVL